MNNPQTGKFAVAMLLAAIALPAVAQQEYPNRPIRLILPAAPGGGTDILGRIVARELSNQVKQPVLVENRASATGTISAELTANAAPDGYTLMLHYHQHTANASLIANLPYHTINDFTPIIQLTTNGLQLLVNGSSPPRNLKEFIVWVRTYKGPLNYGTGGLGSGGHFAGALFNTMAGVNAEVVAYKGSAPAYTALVSGEYQFAFLSMGGSAGLIQSGKLRVLGVTTPKRLAFMADVPAVAEELAGFDVQGWHGILGPARLSRSIVTRLHDGFQKSLNNPEVRDKITAEGSDPVGNTPEEFRRFLIADVEKWARLVKISGVKPQ